MSAEHVPADGDRHGRPPELGRVAPSPLEQDARPGFEGPTGRQGGPRLNLLTRAGAIGQQARVLGLQRTVGNQVVRRLLTQRYEAYEHATEGDKAKGSMTVRVGADQMLVAGTFPGDVPLTSGEVNAMADLYGSPEELANAQRDEIIKVLALIRRQQADPTSVKESEWDDATGGRYSKLNLRNSAHFGASNAALVPPQAGSQDNRQAFQDNYNKAIVYAQDAFHHIGLPDEERKQKMLNLSAVAAGFAEHYIMDAFSAGHLFNKDDFIAQLRGNLDKLSQAQLDQLFGTVAKRILAVPANKALLGQYEPADRPELANVGGVSIPMPFRPNFDKEAVFTGLLSNLYQDPEGRLAVYSALVKVVHDRLDTNKADDKGDIGVPVENDEAQWILTGDKTLYKSADKTTQTMIDKAIEQSRTSLEPYRKGPVKDGANDGPAKVMKYFPRPTADTAKMINQLIAKVTDPNGGMIDALVDVLNAELPSILAGLKRMGKIREA